MTLNLILLAVVLYYAYWASTEWGLLVGPTAGVGGSGSATGTDGATSDGRGRKPVARALGVCGPPSRACVEELKAFTVTNSSNFFVGHSGESFEVLGVSRSGALRLGASRCLGAR